MDIRKEFEEWLGDDAKFDEDQFGKDCAHLLSKSVGVSPFTARAYYAGAKRAEELLFQDPLVVDLRKVEWPVDADHIVIEFYHNRVIKTIPRPKPAWVPSIGEVVLFYYESMVRVGKVEGNYETGVSLKIWENGKLIIIPIKDCRPFNPENIGKRWEDI